MTSPFITTQRLSYRYQRELVVRQLNLEVPAGAIYGFLGPNGAGKSTTIKLLLGLLKPSSGDIAIFGQPLHRHRRSILQRVGALIEAPSLYGQLSARDNLRAMDRLFHKGDRRIEEVLHLVDLQEAAEKKVKRFSMGMKQRLGIAMALFHDPDLLMLDEPVNGLDPAGIQEMRRLFNRLRDAGKTLLISSHILAEVEKIATHVGIIHQGKLRFQGTIEDLQASFRPGFRLRTSNNQSASSILQAKGWPAQQLEEGYLKIDIVEGPEFHRLLSCLIESGLEVYAAEKERHSLEERFFQLTKATSQPDLETVAQ